MTRARIYTLLAMAFVTFGSLGATECSDEQRMVFKKLVGVISEHEDRITALERCDCIGVLAPVCGEDDKTYVNRCEARCAEVPIAAVGVCADNSCGGEEGIACDDGSFCETRPGCDSMAVGMCEEIPDICTDEFAPVCGCDDVTYSNDCERRAAGIPIDFRGDCADPPVECSDNDACMEDEFCRKRQGVCDAGVGICSPKPGECPTHVDPVCGCDGETYSNACAAASAGVAVDSAGMCKKEPVVCTDALDCAADEFCGTRIGQCGGEGICVPVPEVCPRIFAPVCGCDGESYGNRCLAAADGISVDELGKCDDRVVICHFPPGNPGNFHSIWVEEEDVRAHIRNHGDHLGRCEGDDDEDSDSDSDSDRGPYDWYRSTTKQAR